MKNLKLLEWLRNADAETIERTGVTYSYLRLIGYGHKQPSAKAATGIEQATNGHVTRRELRPDDWWQIWPELREQNETVSEASTLVD